VHKGGSGQAERLTVAERNKLNEYSMQRTLRESGIDQDEGISANSWQTYLIDWMVVPLPQIGEVFGELFCSSPEPEDNWWMQRHSTRRVEWDGMRERMCF